MVTLPHLRTRHKTAPAVLSNDGLQAAAGIGVLILLWALWALTNRSLTVTVNGIPDEVSTHRRTVGPLLLDLGLTLEDADLLSVSPSERVRSGMVIDVAQAPTYRLLVDSRELEVASWGKTPIEVVSDAGLQIDHHDRVIINGNQALTDEAHTLPEGNERAVTYATSYAWQVRQDEPLTMRVYRAIPIMVSDGGLAFEVRTTAQTVGEALRQANIVIYRGDTIEPGMATPVNTGLRIYIKRSTPLAVSLDGGYLKTRSQSNTVGDALTEMGIVLAGLDEVQPALDTELYENIEIRITRYAEDIEVEEDIVPFETIFVPDRNLLIDTQQVVNPGAEGITRRRSRVRYRDGEEISRELEDEWIAQEPAQRVIAYGQNIVPNTATVDGQEITYWRRIRMLATSYSASTAGVSPDVSWYGITYSGEPMRKGIVAIDPIVVPLRSKVYVPRYGFGDALDTGSAILAKRIDLGYDDSNLVLWNNWSDVYLLWPPPPEYQITWVLPNFPLER